MKVILDKRISGKTTALIQESAKTDATIVCWSLDMVDAIVRMASEMRLFIRKPVTHAWFLKNKGRGLKAVLIDDADWLLGRLAPGVRIDTITLTKTEEE